MQWLLLEQLLETSVSNSAPRSGKCAQVSGLYLEQLERLKAHQQGMCSSFWAIFRAVGEVKGTSTGRSAYI